MDATEFEADVAAFLEGQVRDGMICCGDLIWTESRSSHLGFSYLFIRWMPRRLLAAAQRNMAPVCTNLIW